MNENGKTGDSYLSSSVINFLGIRTDGHRKKQHADALLFVLAALRNAGVDNINCSHIRDINYNHNLSLHHGKVIYDFAFTYKNNLCLLNLDLVKNHTHGNISPKINTNRDPR